MMVRDLGRKVTDDSNRKPNVTRHTRRDNLRQFLIKYGLAVLEHPPYSPNLIPVLINFLSSGIIADLEEIAFRARQ